MRDEHRLRPDHLYFLLRDVLSEVDGSRFCGVMRICGIGYGEFEIPAARYDALALRALLDKYGGQVPTIH